ncbi:MAG: GHKL domain-containing protein [Hyphomicrobiales bacterium]|nr:GHKL domain-containing protein [Hyphomicrobiales bacterium]
MDRRSTYPRAARFLGDRGFAADVSDRARADEAERPSQEARMELARFARLGEISASIAHEVSQPLAAVIMNTGTAARLLNAEPPDLEEARKLLASIARDAWRASDMIGNIRALAKKYPVLMERFEINDAIREALALTQGEIVRNRVELKTKLADPGPAIQGDRVQLQQVILNLILNAIEAMGHCEPRELSIETGKDVRGSLIVSVSDSGRGLDCAERNRLFQSFYSTKPGGTGMGLAVCRSIVESHEGKIWAASHEGPGATFAFTLPLAE